MKVNPPLNEAPSQSLIVTWLAWSQGWSAFFTALFEAVGWTKSWSYRFTLDFGSVAANAESTGLTITIPGVIQGDCVYVTPYINTVGINYKGLVTADSVVTIYALNNTVSSINPISMQYRVVVIQNS